MIKDNVRKILSELPDGVKIVAAAKTRTAEEVLEAIEAGIKIIGENYMQDALSVYPKIGKKAEWHFIGHLQKNKVKKAVEIFDMIETVDSIGLAEEINKRCNNINKIMPVLVEINSGMEEQKFGVLPEDAVEFVKKISQFENIKVMGLMTMGPRVGNPEDSRIYFSETKKVFDMLTGLNLKNVEMRYLSMGMTNSYKIAIEVGANMVRIGTLIFGERK